MPSFTAFESEEEYDYNIAMQAQAEAEYEQEQAYQEYLGKLLEGGNIELFLLERVIDMLMSREFTKSGMTPMEFFIMKKNKLVEEGNNKPPLEDFFI